MSQGAQLWLLRQETPGFIARDSSYQKDVCTIQHGSIGWSVGATPGYARSLPYKRVIACIVDGSFQLIAIRFADDSTSCVDFAAVLTKEYHLRYKQWWIHHRS
uniref:Uncharacterized protein n=1 Tax=Populus alba TaxID=43335 RepID=A0A4U5Q1C3_POPAL|nr:hypothetical protein D5086_0000168920 [Populus alba]